MRNSLLLAMVLVGCAGSDGRDGTDGAPGMNGMDGADGADGADGMNGTNGGNGVVRTVVVSPGADATASGTALAAAIQDFVTNATKASATSPWLIKIEPGIYDIGATGLDTVPFVDIEGSGEGSTTIRGTGVTLTIDADIELRNLTVRCEGTDCVAVQNTNASPTISNVTIVAANLTTLSWAFGSTSGNPYLRDVTVIATGVDANALWFDAGVPFLRNVDAYATGNGTYGPTGLNVINAGPTVVDSTITAVANPATASSTGLYYARAAGTVTTDFDDVTVVATGNDAFGVYATSAVIGVEINVQDSTIKGSTLGVGLADDEAITMLTANTMIAGGFDTGANDANTLVCINDYDDGYYALVDGDAYTTDVTGACTSTAP